MKSSHRQHGYIEGFDIDILTSNQLAEAMELPSSEIKKSQSITFGDTAPASFNIYMLLDGQANRCFQTRTEEQTEKHTAKQKWFICKFFPDDYDWHRKELDVIVFYIRLARERHCELYVWKGPESLTEGRPIQNLKDFFDELSSAPFAKKSLITSILTAKTESIEDYYIIDFLDYCQHLKNLYDDKIYHFKDPKKQQNNLQRLSYYCILPDELKLDNYQIKDYEEYLILPSILDVEKITKILWHSPTQEEIYLIKKMFPALKSMEIFNATEQFIQHEIYLLYNIKVILEQGFHYLDIILDQRLNFSDLTISHNFGHITVSEKTELHSLTIRSSKHCILLAPPSIIINVEAGTEDLLFNNKINFNIVPKTTATPRWKITWRQDLHSTNKTDSEFDFSNLSKLNYLTLHYRDNSPQEIMLSDASSLIGFAFNSIFPFPKIKSGLNPLTYCEEIKLKDIDFRTLPDKKLPPNPNLTFLTITSCRNVNFCLADFPALHSLSLLDNNVFNISVGDLPSSVRNFSYTDTANYFPFSFDLNPVFPLLEICYLYFDTPLEKFTIHSNTIKELKLNYKKILLRCMLTIGKCPSLWKLNFSAVSNITVALENCSELKSLTLGCMSLEYINDLSFLKKLLYVYISRRFSSFELFNFSPNLSEKAEIFIPPPTEHNGTPCIFQSAPAKKTPTSVRFSSFHSRLDPALDTIPLTKIEAEGEFKVSIAMNSLLLPEDRLRLIGFNQIIGDAHSASFMSDEKKMLPVAIQPKLFREFIINSLPTGSRKGWGHITGDALNKDKYYPLPDMGPQPSPEKRGFDSVFLKPLDAATFFWNSETKQYYFKPSYPTAITIFYSTHFVETILDDKKIPVKIDTSLLPESLHNQLSLELKKIPHARFLLSTSLSLTEKVKQLTEFCQNYKPIPLTTITTNSFEQLLAPFKEGGKGRCDARSETYMLLMHWLGVPVLMNQSATHRWCSTLVNSRDSIHYDHTDLGGVAFLERKIIEQDPIPEAYRINFDERKTPLHLPLLVDTSEKTIEKRYTTYFETLGKPTLFDSVKNLYDNLEESPLITLENGQTGFAVDAILQEYANDNNIPYISLHAPHELKALLFPVVYDEKSILKTQETGPLTPFFLNDGKSPYILVINATEQRFGANDLAIFKSLLDTPPTLSELPGQTISPYLRIIWLTDSETEMCSAFTSRCKPCKLNSTFFITKPLEEKKEEKSAEKCLPIEVDLRLEEHWQYSLFGNPQKKDGAIFRAIFTRQPLTLQNAPFHDPNFVLFLHRARCGRFFFNGEAYAVPPSVVIKTEDKHYDKFPSNVLITLENKEPCRQRKINLYLANLHALKKGVQMHMGEGINYLSGLLEQYDPENEVFYIIGSISSYQWDGLMESIRLFFSEKKFHFVLAPQVSVGDIKNSSLPWSNPRILFAEDPYLAAEHFTLSSSSSEPTHGSKTIIPVSPYTRYEDLIALIKLNYYEEKIVLKELKKGNTVILVGKLSAVLYQQLYSLLDTTPYLDCNHTRMTFPGSLVVVMPLSYQKNLNLISYSLVSKSFRGIRLEMLKSISISDAYLTTNLATPTEFNQQCLAAERLIADEKSPLIIFKGLAGSIKDIMLEKLEGSTHFYCGEEHFISWLNQVPSSRRPILFVLKECDIGGEGKWEFLKSLFQSKPCIYYKGDLFEISPFHKIIVDWDIRSSRVSEHTVFMRFGEIVSFTKPDRQCLQEQILDVKLDAPIWNTLYEGYLLIQRYCPYLNFSYFDLMSLVERFLFMRSKSFYYSPYEACVSELSGYIQDPKKINSFIEELRRIENNTNAEESKLEASEFFFKTSHSPSLLPPHDECLSALLKKMHSTETYDEKAFDVVSGVKTDFLAPVVEVGDPKQFLPFPGTWTTAINTIRQTLDMVLNSMELHALPKFKRMLVLEGESGLGKSTLYQAITAYYSMKVTQVTAKSNSEEIQRAMIHAYCNNEWLILDELNALDKKSQSLLVGLISGKFQPTNPYFIVLASSNPSGNYKGRKSILPELLNYSLRIFLNQPIEDELRVLAKIVGLDNPKVFVEVFLKLMREYPLNLRSFQKALKHFLPPSAPPSSVSSQFFVNPRKRNIESTHSLISNKDTEEEEDQSPCPSSLKKSKFIMR